MLQVPSESRLVIYSVGKRNHIRELNQATYRQRNALRVSSDEEKSETEDLVGSI